MYSYCILLKHLSNHIHFITNGYKLVRYKATCSFKVLNCICIYYFVYFLCITLFNFLSDVAFLCCICWPTERFQTFIRLANISLDSIVVKQSCQHLHLATKEIWYNSQWDKIRVTLFSKMCSLQYEKIRELSAESGIIGSSDPFIQYYKQ